MDKSAALRQFSFYANSPRSFQGQVESASTWSRLAQGRYFVREGDVCPQFALLISGSLRVYKASDTGRQITLYHVSAGQTCLANMLCTFLGTPSPASAIVEESVESLIIPASAVQRWIGDNESMREFIFQSMANRFLDVMMLVQEITFGKLDRRLADFLLRSSCARNGIRLRDLTATHEEIAAELGSAREVVSRLLKEFQRLGAIETHRGRILLRDATVLERLVSESTAD